MRPYAQEVYVSRRRLVRIVQLRDVDADSKKWAADPLNRKCDAPGSWYCPGDYPPKLRALFDERISAHSAETRAEKAEAIDYRKLYSDRLMEQEKSKALPNEPGIPPGSYLGSCRGCSRDGPVLRCTHCRGIGPSVDSTLDLRNCMFKAREDDPYVDNIQGSLQCTPRPNSANILPGRYRNSCQVRWKILVARTPMQTLYPRSTLAHFWFRAVHLNMGVLCCIALTVTPQTVCGLRRHITWIVACPLLFLITWMANSLVVACPMLLIFRVAHIRILVKVVGLRTTS